MKKDVCMLKKAFCLLFRFVSILLLDICFFWANFIKPSVEN